MKLICRMIVNLIVFINVLTVANCAKITNSDPQATSSIQIDNAGTRLIPDQQGIKTYVLEKHYQQWLAEPEIHAKSFNSPHGHVRVFFNDIAVDNLKQSKANLDIGSMLIKELYQSDKKTLSGYSVMVKTSENSWTWLESFDPQISSVDYYGVDLPICKNCHSQAGSIDQIVSKLPR